jgi:hypothetical protein
MKPTWLIVASAFVLASVPAAHAQKTGVIAKAVITPSAGEQKKPIMVAIKVATPDAVIRYTLDGTTPTEDTGMLYSAPFNVDKTTTVTAVAFLKGKAPNLPAISTYLFDPRPGLDTFHIGNSLTNTTAKFADFVRSAGIIHKYQSFTAGGALTSQLWDIQLPKRQEEWDKKLAGYKKIDHFTVQPRDFNKGPKFDVDREADYASRFFDVIRKHSPDMQPWFYAEWVEKQRQRPTDKALVPSRQMKELNAALTWEESMGAMLLYNEDLQAKVLDTYKEGKRPRVLPSCLAMGWIKNMIDNGKVPGAPADADAMYKLLFADGVHPNVKGGYLVDLTWYAAFYRESPEGKVLPVGAGLTSEQARIMQKLAWDVVKNYPDCGLYEEGRIQIAKPMIAVGEAKKGIAPVTLSAKTPGAWFRYTLDGTEPTRTRGYVYCGIINVPAGKTLKAIAYKSGLADSEVVSMTVNP